MFPLNKSTAAFSSLCYNPICGKEEAKKDSTQAVVYLKTKQEELFNVLIFPFTDILMLYNSVCYLQMNSQVSESYYATILQG